MSRTPASEVSLEVRLWSRVMPFDVRDPSACADFCGHQTAAGYGTLHDSETGEVVYAHRAMWSLCTGEEIPEGHVIRHTCNRPSCIRPGHLRLGTPADNERDKAEAGRHRVLPKLNDADVRAIRHCYATERFSTGDLSRLFFSGSGAGQPAVQRIVAGITYRNAGGPIIQRGRGRPPKRRDR